MLNIDDIWSKLKPRILGLMGVPTAYTPVWTAATANPAIGNGTLTGNYILRGKLCLFNIYLQAGSTTTFGTGNWEITLPLMVASSTNYRLGLAQIYDAGTAFFTRLVSLSKGGKVVGQFIADNSLTYRFNSTTPMTWAVGDALQIQGEYEVE